MIGEKYCKIMVFRELFIWLAPEYYIWSDCFMSIVIICGHVWARWNFLFILKKYKFRIQKSYIWALDSLTSVGMNVLRTCLWREQLSRDVFVCIAFVLHHGAQSNSAHFCCRSAIEVWRDAFANSVFWMHVTSLSPPSLEQEKPTD